jgi:hypothetical protein
MRLAYVGQRATLRKQIPGRGARLTMISSAISITAVAAALYSIVRSAGLRGSHS